MQQCMYFVFRDAMVVCASDIDVQGTYHMLAVSSRTRHNWMGRYSLRTRMAINYANDLNAEQWEVIRTGDGPCLVLAGAGSGKTRTIVYRVAHLLEQGVLPQEILLLTFTNKAAREMLARVELLLGRHPDGLWGGTFHHIASRILRRFASQVGYASNFTILDEEDTHDLLRASVKAVGVDTTARRFPAPAVLRAAISFGRNAQRPLAEVVEQRYAKFSPLVPAIEEVARHYDARKRASNAMDFDDLLLNLLQLLGGSGGATHPLTQQFRYVLVDEYQDTNRIQAAIVSCFAAAHRNLLVVGDDAQSIYSFRSARVKNILEVPRRFDPAAEVITLEQNYRATQPILDACNRVIGHAPERYLKNLYSLRPGGERPAIAMVDDEAAQVEFVIERVLANREAGMELREQAVLFRASHHSGQLEVELTRRGIPYVK
ncbi:ATP-dependent helicase, partial [Candidatus Uhrbacteria bacterium]|nr:ATP-dependent helicase [Candidatus Uhrbacteria bacterium]